MSLVRTGGRSLPLLGPLAVALWSRMGSGGRSLARPAVGGRFPSYDPLPLGLDAHALWTCSRRAASASSVERARARGLSRARARRVRGRVARGAPWQIEM